MVDYGAPFPNERKKDKGKKKREENMKNSKH